MRTLSVCQPIICRQLFPLNTLEGCAIKQNGCFNVGCKKLALVPSIPMVAVITLRRPNLPHNLCAKSIGNYKDGREERERRSITFFLHFDEFFLLSIKRCYLYSFSCFFFSMALFPPIWFNSHRARERVDSQTEF